MLCQKKYHCYGCLPIAERKQKTNGRRCRRMATVLDQLPVIGDEKETRRQLTERWLTEVSNYGGVERKNNTSGASTYYCSSCDVTDQRHFRVSCQENAYEEVIENVGGKLRRFSANSLDHTEVAGQPSGSESATGFVLPTRGRLSLDGQRGRLPRPASPSRLNRASSAEFQKGRRSFLPAAAIEEIYEEVCNGESILAVSSTDSSDGAATCPSSETDEIEDEREEEEEENKVSHDRRIKSEKLLDKLDSNDRLENDESISGSSFFGSRSDYTSDSSDFPNESLDSISFRKNRIVDAVPSVDDDRRVGSTFSGGRGPPRRVDYLPDDAVFKSFHQKYRISVLPDSDGRLGLGVMGGRTKGAMDSGIFVRSVRAEGPAARTGRIRPGDEILLVNGIDLRGRTSEEALRALKTESEKGRRVLEPVYFELLRRKKMETYFKKSKENGEQDGDVLLSDELQRSAPIRPAVPTLNTIQEERYLEGDREPAIATTVPARRSPSRRQKSSTTMQEARKDRILKVHVDASDIYEQKEIFYRPRAQSVTLTSASSAQKSPVRRRRSAGEKKRSYSPSFPPPLPMAEGNVFRGSNLVEWFRIRSSEVTSGRADQSEDEVYGYLSRLLVTGQLRRVVIDGLSCKPTTHNHNCNCNDSNRCKGGCNCNQTQRFSCDDFYMIFRAI